MKPTNRSSIRILAAAYLTIAGLLAPITHAQPAETAWQAMADDVTLGPLERAVLNVLTPDQYDSFVDGADPASLVLTSGETLADFLEGFATKGAVTEGLVYYPLPRCIVLETWSSTDGQMTANERRDFIVRGETTDLSDQGGSATGCGVPTAAEALMVNFRVSDHGDDTGQLRVYARDQSAGYPLIHYQADTELISTNATALDLCLQASCNSDFRVWTKNAAAHVRMDVLGYFAPLGTGGLNTDGTTSTGDLTITGLDCTSNANGGALTADASGVVSCSDDDAGDDLGSHNATQNLDLDTFKLVGNGGTDGLSIAADGTVTFDQPLNGVDLDMGNLTQTPGDPVLVGSVGTGPVPISVFVSGRYAYVGDASSNDLRVIDVSDPSTPSQTGLLAIGEDPVSVFVAGRYAYVVDSLLSTLAVIDVSDPSAPTLVGGLGTSISPQAVYVSGHYAYVVTSFPSELQVIDVSDPSNPSLIGSISTGSSPQSVYVSGRYAYVVTSSSTSLQVIDVSDPSNPSLAGSLGIGSNSQSIFVSGRYAYVLNVVSNDLKAIDVSDPSTPSLAGSVAIGDTPVSLFVSGRYAYVVTQDLDALKVFDISDPSTPSMVGSLGIGFNPLSVFVSGRYAYVVDSLSDDLKVIDISGAEVTSMIAHSLEAGSLQVRESLTAQGQLSVTGGVNIGAGGLFSDGNVGISGTLALANDVAPTASPANLVQLYAEDAAGSSELKVRDEAGNVTTLSPHNFSLIGEASEPLAWSYYSENDHGRINVDMLRAMRVLEQVAGEKLVHIDAGASPDRPASPGLVPMLLKRIEALDIQAEILFQENRGLRSKNRQLEQDLERIKEVLGLD